MKSIAVIFWSGTGNTEAMARAVAEGAREKGADADVIHAADLDAGTIGSYGAAAFGCPALGDEGLEETELEPKFAACEGALAKMRVALFGSYGWGGGAWMRAWEDRCASSGIALAAESVICCETPDDDALARCRALGEYLAG